MQTKTYELFYGEISIGTISEVDSDFPNMFGDIAYSTWLNTPRTTDQERLSEFIELTKESTRLINLEDDSMNQKIEEIDAKLMSEFRDILQSNKWYLSNDDGKQSILPPILNHDNEITWRWNH